MAYLLSNICTKNYWKWTTIIEIIFGGWVVSFFSETQCTVWHIIPLALSCSYMDIMEMTFLCFCIVNSLWLPCVADADIMFSAVVSIFFLHLSF